MIQNDDEEEEDDDEYDDHNTDDNDDDDDEEVEKEEEEEKEEVEEERDDDDDDDDDHDGDGDDDDDCVDPEYAPTLPPNLLTKLTEVGDECCIICVLQILVETERFSILLLGKANQRIPSLSGMVTSN
ncbi:hypothetical protein DPMN_021564 [Dreissena polymorpha]|uniref:Uncharacterized protein n=1 Tax=Dreissena polymorpha TaxID=45954 RepID=A0A9D4SA25_DREPO|nr:hypothetical protein DPMN_021564 [Dreissena polymorpha]